MSVRRKACCSTGAPFYRRPENTDTDVFSQEVIKDTDLTHYKLLYLKTCGHWFYANKICEYYAKCAKTCAAEEIERNRSDTDEDPKCDMNCPMCREQFYPSDLDWVDPPIPATVEGLQELFAEKELAQKKLKHWQVNTMGRPFNELYVAMRAFMKQKLATSEHDSGETVFMNNNGGMILFDDRVMEIQVCIEEKLPMNNIVKYYRPWTTREVAILANSPWERRKGGSVLVDDHTFASVSQFLTAALSRQKNEDICDAMKKTRINSDEIHLKQEIEDWLYGYFGEDENLELGLPGSTQQAAAYRTARSTYINFSPGSLYHSLAWLQESPRWETQRQSASRRSARKS